MTRCHRRDTRYWGLLGAVLALGGLQACRGDDTDPARRGIAPTALRANRVPAQVIGEERDSNDADAGTDRTGKRFGGDAGVVPPTPLRDREQLGNDALSLRDTTGILIDAEWRWSDVPAPSNAPETSAEALETLRNGTRLRMRIDVVAVGRMRVGFIGNGYPWPDGTELRARSDRLGHVLVWPDGKRYRSVVPGALRALFADRRLDRGHLFVPKITSQPPGSVLGQTTVRQILNTPVGELHLEQVSVPAAGDGAILLCRLLVELMGIDPDTRACSSDQLVLRANLTSAPGGKLQFVVNQYSKKQELPLSAVQVPPDGSRFEISGIPVPTGASVPRVQLEAMRVHPISTAISGKDAPKQGLTAVNHALGLRALLIDGLAVAWLQPGSEVTLPELKNGTYNVSWRDFFGTFVEPAKQLVLPARVTLGKAIEVGG